VNFAKAGTKVLIASALICFGCCGGPILLLSSFSGQPVAGHREWKPPSDTVITVAGNTAAVKKTISGTEVQGKWIQHDTMDLVYHLAKKHPELEVLSIEYIRDLEGYSDRYGKPLAQRMKRMGTMILDSRSLDEARKYVTLAAFRQDDTQIFYYIELMNSIDMIKILNWPPKQKTLEEKLKEEFGDEA
jgi:hypothetical protein